MTARRPKDIGTDCVICGAPTASRRALTCSRYCNNKRRAQKYANNPKPRKPRPSLEERFWSRVDRSQDCWEWQGYCRPRGYGQISDGRTLRETHRLAYELANGPIPKGLVVRHKCDNPPCCNPAHLELGTDADNVRDMVQRGRQAVGARLPHTKLSDREAVEIRAQYRTFTVPGRRGKHSNAKELAERYGVTAAYLQQLVHRYYRKSVA